MDCFSQDHASCLQCLANEYPNGAKLYGALSSCVFCTACVKSCASGACPPSPNPDKCDMGTCGDSQTGCVSCALQATCYMQYEACKSDMECVTFAQSQNACPP